MSLDSPRFSVVYHLQRRQGALFGSQCQGAFGDCRQPGIRLGQLGWLFAGQELQQPSYTVGFGQTRPTASRKSD